MRALDLFSGAGGAAMGLHRAGFEVVGVDHLPQPKFPFTFLRADALAPPLDLSRFDLIWASPPCQLHSSLKALAGDHHEDLIPQTREMLQASGAPYIIENVVGAPLIHPVKLCGSMFGLGCEGAELRRHRLFECSFMVLVPECYHGGPRNRTIGVYGGLAYDPYEYHAESRLAHNRRFRTITITGNTPQQNVVRNRVRETFTVDDARQAMGIDWMSMKELSQAIPPAYSEYLARAFLAEESAGRPAWSI